MFIDREKEIARLQQALQHEEPERLFSDEMRTSIPKSTILS